MIKHRTDNSSGVAVATNHYIRHRCLVPSQRGRTGDIITINLGFRLQPLAGNKGGGATTYMGVLVAIHMRTVVLAVV